MQNQLRFIRIFFMVMSVAGAITAGALCQVNTLGRTDHNYNGQVSVFTPLAVDGAVDGAAAGFGVMSGLAMVALAITFLRKEQ